MKTTQLASRTQLPPSPELKAVTAPNLPMPPLFTAPSRLVSLASYSHLQPTCIACSEVTAIAGKQGIALLSSQPTTTLPGETAELLAWHETTLAAAHGAALVVWKDAPTTRLLADGPIGSLAWTPSGQVVATTPQGVSLWDVRQAKPAQRWAVSNAIQVVSDDQQCTILDSSGRLRVWDRKATSIVSQWNAFQRAGVGLTAFGSDRWLTWGMDDDEEALVKIWKPSQEADADEYWLMEQDATVNDRRLVASVRTKKLACARVCPQIPNRFVTVGFADKEFRTELWETKKDSVESIVSFQCGMESDASLQNVLGKDPSALGSLIACDVGLAMGPARSEGTSDEETTLMLYSLTDKGYLLSHVSLVLLLRRLVHLDSHMSPVDTRGDYGRCPEACRTWKERCSEGSI